MNANIKLLLKEDFPAFLKLIHLGIIDKDVACNAIIEERNLEYILTFAFEFNYNINLLEDTVINMKDVKYIYYFARYIKGANILKLEDATTKTGRLQYIYKFASEVKGANILKLEDALITNFYYFYHYNFKAYDYSNYVFYYQYLIDFASIPGADILKLEDVAIKTKGIRCIYSFAHHVKGANILKLEDALIEAIDDYYDIIKYVIKFANIKNADISKLEDAVIKKGTPRGIYSFAKEVKGANILKLEDGLINTLCPFLDYDRIIEFASIPGADIKKLEKAILDMNTDEYDKSNYLIKFANIFGANIENLENAVIETQVAECIYSFAKEVKGANISKLEDAVIKYDLDGRYIKWFIDDIEGANIRKLKEALWTLNKKRLIKSKEYQFKNNPELSKLIILLAKEENDKILESQTTYAELFQDDKGPARKLEKHEK